MSKPAAFCKATIVFLLCLNGCQKEGLTIRDSDGGTADGPTQGGTGGVITAQGGSPGSGGAVGTGGSSTAQGGSPGSGGAVGTGGSSTAQGGSPGSGGAVGTGGKVGSGGTVGTGGKVGTGGAMATGGSTGQGGGGGTAGAAGQDGGGMGGQGGQAIDGGKTCSQLVTDYADALIVAKQCTPGAIDQCQQLVQGILSSCTGCEQYVNDSTTLTAIRKQWTNQGCMVPVLCPAIACIMPGPSTCVTTGTTTGGPAAGTPTGGVCTTVLTGTTN
jgi:hypothetical protein